MFTEVKYALTEDWRYWVGGRFATGPSGFGWWSELTAGHRFSSREDGTGTEAWLYLSVSDADFVNRSFGIPSTDAANTDFPETTLDGGFRSVGLFITDRRKLTKNLQLITKIGTEFYSSDIQDSPLAQDDYKLEVGVVLLWQF